MQLYFITSINYLVGPTHSTTRGPHWEARRQTGREWREGCPFP